VHTHPHQLKAEYPVSYRGTDADAIRGLKVLLMKRIAWLILVAYTLLIFKPVMPVVIDVLAHTFWEQQHLLTVHEVNGKFHVHNELVNASHQSEKDKQSASGKYITDEYFPETRSVIYAPQELYTDIDIFLFYSPFYPFSIRDIDNPPPEA